MRWIRNLFFGLMVFGIANSCLKEPEYSTTPEITFNNFYYGYSPASGVDSIVLTFNFKDGDGDIGLETADDTFRPYWDNYYFYLQDNLLYTTNDPNLTDPGIQYINYKTKRTNPTFSLPDLTVPGDNPPSVQLPDFVSPYSCYNWEPKNDVNGVPVDTVYKQENPYYWNMFVDFYVRNNSGVFVKFDLLEFISNSSCPPEYPFSGRIPILSSDLGKRSPLEGLIHYSIGSVVQLRNLFSIHTLKLQFYIVDRALHKSKSIESPEFTLDQIRKQ